MKEFQINKYLTLKLEDGGTNIYVAEELFRQCKFLLLNIPVKKINDLNEIDSVDEAAESLSKEMEEIYNPWGAKEAPKPNIPPEVEFWAHSSNLQVWSEHNYDTRLIHSNLAFPLLKRLTEVGDLQAKRIFREEIAKRLESGYWPVIEYLIKGEYTEYLSREEFLQCILEDENEVQFLREIEKRNDIAFYIEKELSGEYNNFTVENKRIVGLDIYYLDLNEILPSIGRLKFLKKLYLMGKNLKALPNSICMLDSLKVLDLVNNQLTDLPKNFGNLKSLKELNLGDNKFIEMPKELGNLKNLKELRLYKNNIHDISPFRNLQSLTHLDLRKNQINKNSRILKDLKKKGIEILI